MSEEKMPAAEAAHYELAFHVLPTVAEGEVADVVSKLRSTIEAAGGTITEEEAPARFDLAYDIVKYLEGRNRKFSSAYFGWVRFTLEPSKVTEVNEVLENTTSLLRHLLIRMTKAEEAHVFMFHEALEDNTSETIDLDATAPAEVEENQADEATQEKEDKKEENGEEAKTEVK